MLSKTLEFYRIADVSPSDETVRKRSSSAEILVGVFVKTKDQDVLLPCIQGVVAGFNEGHFKPDSPVLDAVFQPIHKLDMTVPSDLKENAVILRAVAAIAVGELLALPASAEAEVSDKAQLAATALVSSLSSRSPVAEIHLKSILDALLSASNAVLKAAGDERRRRNLDALEALTEIQTSEDEDADVWERVKAAVADAIREVHRNDEINREELETLWWLFARHSELEDKPLDQLSVGETALTAGIELAQRALLPPPKSSAGIIKRATEHGRKPEELGSVKLQELADSWTAGMSAGFSSPSPDALVAAYPVLFPVTATCLRVFKDGKAAKTMREIKELTALSATHALTPTQWGQQIFREKILQRVLADRRP